MMSPTLKISRTFWRWYSALLLANALDLLFTYTAIERGFHEWNPLLQPMLLTPWLIVVKLAVFAPLAWGLWHTVRRDRAIRPVLSLLQSVTMVYLFVIALHVVGLFARGG